MSNGVLIALIFGISAIIVLVSVGGFMLFRNFLRAEEQKGENFRAVHKPRD